MMRVLVLGAGGFVGRHIVAELVGHGFEVIGTVRRADGIAAAFPNIDFKEIDLANATHPSDWQAAVTGVDLIVNAAGILQGPTMQAIHVDMPAALHAAACISGVKRIILISAISARANVPTDYSRSKLEEEAAVRRSGLGWTILRPSLVYAEGSYGGTSLLRGLAALPWVVPIPGDGEFAFSPIHARDLAQTVRLACEDDRFDRLVLEPVGPETITLRYLLKRYRAWLGFGRGHIVQVPMPVMRFIASVGNLAGDGPISRNSLAQLIAGNAGDSDAFVEAVGFRPRSIDDALQAQPAQVQDRWHARLFFLAPAIRATLVLLWLASAMLGMFAGQAMTARFVSAAGLSAHLIDPLRIGTCILDVLMAGLVLTDGGARRSTPVQLFVILAYCFVLGIVLPGLWLDPLGPLLKNLPVMMLVVVHGVIANKR